MGIVGDLCYFKCNCLCVKFKANHSVITQLQGILGAAHSSAYLTIYHFLRSWDIVDGFS